MSLWPYGYTFTKEYEESLYSVALPADSKSIEARSLSFSKLTGYEDSAFDTYRVIYPILDAINIKEPPAIREIAYRILQQHSTALINRLRWEEKVEEKTKEIKVRLPGRTISCKYSEIEPYSNSFVKTPSSADKGYSEFVLVAPFYMLSWTHNPTITLNGETIDYKPTFSTLQDCYLKKRWQCVDEINYKELGFKYQPGLIADTYSNAIDLVEDPRLCEVINRFKKRSHE
ncbi:MAG: hypothetical protein K9M07_05410 [Simkaniaceae bacterium]|nr:hypothetical protein [Simkaniaceae bacterium]MCF7852657.1 hypothetical protein [Simkaniaceae bacterium]